MIGAFPLNESAEVKGYPHIGPGYPQTYAHVLNYPSQGSLLVCGFSTHYLWKTSQWEESCYRLIRLFSTLRGGFFRRYSHTGMLIGPLYPQIINQDPDPRPVTKYNMVTRTLQVEYLGK
jgi:hypothetical protein